jgi:hypothetical protein
MLPLGFLHYRKYNSCCDNSIVFGKDIPYSIRSLIKKTKIFTKNYGKCQ